MLAGVKREQWIWRLSMLRLLNDRVGAYAIAGAVSTVFSWLSWSNSNVVGTWISVVCLVLVEICIGVDILMQRLRSSGKLEPDERLLFSGMAQGTASIVLSFAVFLTVPPGPPGRGEHGCEYSVANKGVISCIARETYDKMLASLPMLLLAFVTLFGFVIVSLVLSWIAPSGKA